MVKSMFAAIAGLKAHQSRMDVLSNNIANINTWGYKSRSANFADSMYQNVLNGASGGGGTGGMNTSQLGFGVNLGSITTNFTQGSWNPMGDGMTCMINGPSFFIVGGQANGGVDIPLTGNGAQKLADTGLALSRVGIFSFDSQGYLVDNSGNYVYGFKPTTNAAGDVTGFDENNLGRIQIPLKRDANGNLVVPNERVVIKSTTIGSDGTVVGVDEAGTPHTLGQLALASVENVNGLEQQQGYLFGMGPNSGTVTVSSGGTDAKGKILSGYLEMSNVDLASEMATMITTQRGYQANTKIVTVTDEMLEQLVNMKR